MERAPRHPFRPIYPVASSCADSSSTTPFMLAAPTRAHYDFQRLYDSSSTRTANISCAYSAHPGDDLETAQTNKKRLRSESSCSSRGSTSSIRSGWGGWPLYLRASAASS